jgi:hypothetical protein
VVAECVISDIKIAKVIQTDATKIEIAQPLPSFVSSVGGETVLIELLQLSKELA